MCAPEVRAQWHAVVAQNSTHDDPNAMCRITARGVKFKQDNVGRWVSAGVGPRLQLHRETRKVKRRWQLLISKKEYKGVLVVQASFAYFARSRFKNKICRTTVSTSPVARIEHGSTRASHVPKTLETFVRHPIYWR